MIFQIKLSKPATFSSGVGWSFVKNPIAAGLTEHSVDVGMNNGCTATTGGSATQWGCTSGVTISGGKALLDGNTGYFQNLTSLQSFTGLNNGDVVTITIVVTDINGGKLEVYADDNVLAPEGTITTNGTFTWTTTLIGTGQFAVYSLNSGTTVEIDSISFTSIVVGSEEEIATAVAHTPQTISPTNLPAFSMNWILDPIWSDVVEARYVPGNYSSIDAQADYIFRMLGDTRMQFPSFRFLFSQAGRFRFRFRLNNLTNRQDIFSATDVTADFFFVNTNGEVQVNLGGGNNFSVGAGIVSGNVYRADMKWDGAGNMTLDLEDLTSATAPVTILPAATIQAVDTTIGTQFGRFGSAPNASDFDGVVGTLELYNNPDQTTITDSWKIDDNASTLVSGTGGTSGTITDNTTGFWDIPSTAMVSQTVTLFNCDPVPPPSEGFLNFGEDDGTLLLSMTCSSQAQMEADLVTFGFQSTDLTIVGTADFTGGVFNADGATGFQIDHASLLLPLATEGHMTMWVSPDVVSIDTAGQTSNLLELGSSGDSLLRRTTTNLHNWIGDVQNANTIASTAQQDGAFVRIDISWGAAEGAVYTGKCGREDKGNFRPFTSNKINVFTSRFGGAFILVGAIEKLQISSKPIELNPRVEGVVGFGDSITFAASMYSYSPDTVGATNGGFLDQGYLWGARRFAGENDRKDYIVNQGQNGEASTDLATQIATFAAEAHTGVEIASIMLGVNDLNVEPGTSKVAFKANIQAGVDELFNNQGIKQIILLKTTSTSGDAGRIADRDARTIEYGDAVAEIAASDTARIQVVDAFNAVGGHDQSNTLWWNADKVHLISDGQRQVQDVYRVAYAIAVSKL